MNLLLASNYQPPHMGGIEFAAEALRDCWRTEGHDVTWITTDSPPRPDLVTPRNLRIPAFNLLEDRFQINTPLIGPWHRKTIRDLVAAHDAVNTHSLAPGLSVLVMREALRQGKPLVVTQHVAVIPLRWAALSRLQETYILAQARHLLRGGAPLTFVGKAVRDWFASQPGIDPSRLFMTPAGINQAIYHFVPASERETLRQKWNCPDHTLNLLFVGRFYDKKGLPLLRELAIAFPRVRFTLVGGGPINPATWNLPNLRVLSFVENHQLRELYGAHDLFLMPSYGEGWPAVIPQAMICGCPCLISEECFSGYATDPQHFTVTPRNFDALHAALDALQQTLPLSEEKRRDLSAYAAKTWDWQTTARIYLDLLNTPHHKP
ncbi:MAG TPA: glycosyltransferase family 4 protein [Kiritimatiellia bacterium]|nr:glycosyltransferase family 4 protein [Kiritimatiellia bacterium]